MHRMASQMNLSIEASRLSWKRYKHSKCGRWSSVVRGGKRHPKLDHTHYKDRASSG